MMKKKVIRMRVIMALLLLLLSGCAVPKSADTSGTEQGAVPESAVEIEFGAEVTRPELGEIYIIGTGWSDWWFMNRDGNTIPEDMRFDVLRDLETNQPQCLSRTKTEDTGRRSEYGDPIVRTLSALYDIDGNLLRDWEEVSYGAAFGDFIIRQDPRRGIVDASEIPKNYRTALWNYKTMQESFADVMWVQMTGHGDFLLLNRWSSPLGIVDRQGNIITGFPPPETYYNAYTTPNGLILASKRNYYEDTQTDGGKPVVNDEFLLDRDLQPVLSRESLNAYDVYGDYLIYGDGEQRGVISSVDGSELFTATEGVWIEYYDGDVIIMRDAYDPEKPNDQHWWLADANGNVLADGYKYLGADTTFFDYYGKSAAEHFVGVRAGGADLLDGKGNVIASVELPPDTASVNPIGSGLYIYTVERRDPDTGEYLGSAEGLLGPDFKVLIPDGIYSGIWRERYYPAGVEVPLDILRGSKQINGVYRYDMLTPSGKVIAANLSSVRNVGPDRMAVIMGFEAGLMDWKGNWIVKKPIFYGLIDD